MLTKDTRIGFIFCISCQKIYRYSPNGNTLETLFKNPVICLAMYTITTFYLKLYVVVIKTVFMYVSVILTKLAINLYSTKSFFSCSGAGNVICFCIGNISNILFMDKDIMFFFNHLYNHKTEQINYHQVFSLFCVSN